MKKKLTGRLNLSRETVRTLDDRFIEGIVGGLSARCTSEGSAATCTCDSCVQTTAHSLCC